jgi:GNAT superfamily N-acetyltransferase
LHSIELNRRPGRVHAHREANAIATLTLAFSSDPTNRWCWPEASEYLAGFPKFVRALGGNAFAAECAFEIAGGAGAALWLPPGVEPDEAELIEIIHGSVHGSRQSDLYELLRQSAEFHPKTPHWYLPFVGVEPLQQYRGLGSRLLRPILDRCDSDRLPAYLESTNPRNIPFYESLGFRSMGIIQAGRSPRIVPMLREPQ